VSAAWTFDVIDSFEVTGRGPAVVGHIVGGVVHEGDRFVVAEADVQGTVRAVAPVRSDDRDAIGLLVDVKLLAGTRLTALS
jgi:hypothetical protein